MKKPEAREIVYQLVAKSDVFVQNFRKGVAQRLGLDYQTLQRDQSAAHLRELPRATVRRVPTAASPRSITSRNRAPGVMHIAGIEGDEPVYLFGGVADQMGAIMLSYGVITALLARERYGVGQEVNASHLGSMIALQGLNVACRNIMGTEFRRNTRENAFNPLWNHYRCADGKWLTLGMLQADRYWKDFCNTLGLPELIEDPRFKDISVRGKNCKALVAIFDQVFITKPRDEWMKLLKAGGDFIYTVVNRVSDLPDDSQVLANDYVVDYEHPGLGAMKLVGFPVKLSETPGQSARPRAGVGRTYRDAADRDARLQLGGRGALERVGSNLTQRDTPSGRAREEKLCRRLREASRTASRFASSMLATRSTSTRASSRSG